MQKQCQKQTPLEPLRLQGRLLGLRGQLPAREYAIIQMPGNNLASPAVYEVKALFKDERKEALHGRAESAQCHGALRHRCLSPGPVPDTQNIQDAEDVYQDVFLRLLGQDAEDWDTEHLRSWLLRCTVNGCNDLYRFRLRRPVLALAEVPETAQPLAEGAAELWEMVAALPEKLRIPIHLHYAEGYSTEEIAGLLDIPAATVRTRLHRGRKQLHNLLGGDEHAEKSISELNGTDPAPRRAE